MKCDATDIIFLTIYQVKPKVVSVPIEYKALCDETREIKMRLFKIIATNHKEEAALSYSGIRKNLRWQHNRVHGATVSHLQNSRQLNARTCRLGKSGMLNDGSASKSGSFEFLLQPLTYIHASHTTRLFRSEKAPHMIALSLTLGNHQRASHLSGVLSACGRDAY